MPRFRFEAMGSGGEAECGHVQAADAERATQLLRQKGLFVTTLAEVAEDDAAESSASSDLLTLRVQDGARSSPLPGRWIGAVLVVVGLATFAVGLYGVIESICFRIGAERAAAVVVDRESTGGAKFYDVLGFTAGGRDYRVPKRGCFGVRFGPSFTGLGARWEVLYPTDHPEHARVAGFGYNFGGPLILLALGVLFTPLGALIRRSGLQVVRK